MTFCWCSTTTSHFCPHSKGPIFFNRPYEIKEQVPILFGWWLLEQRQCHPLSPFLLPWTKLRWTIKKSITSCFCFLGHVTAWPTSRSCNQHGPRTATCLVSLAGTFSSIYHRSIDLTSPHLTSAIDGPLLYESDGQRRRVDGDKPSDFCSKISLSN